MNNKKLKFLFNSITLKLTSVTKSIN